MRLQFAFAAILLIFGSSCTSAYIESIGGETARVFERIYFTDFNTAWQSSLEALKTSQMDVSNREGGYILTKWSDNTAAKNFSDSFKGADSYLKAQYRFRVVVSKGYYNGQPTVKVSVEKEQMVLQDVLEDWRPIPTDTIDETTLLYRVARIIYMRMKLAKIEEEKAKKELENSGF